MQMATQHRWRCWINHNFFADWFKLFTCVETSYLNTDMSKFESSQKGESRAHSADSSKAYSNLKLLIVEEHSKQM